MRSREIISFFLLWGGARGFARCAHLWLTGELFRVLILVPVDDSLEVIGDSNSLFHSVSRIKNAGKIF